ncbi:hypothetical protein V3H18_02450 [Methylocystis sp. 9N]|uniref:O-GlcNAc transferase C-terminal domain-containing protein n=1 Tax=Methylocystis borbori TaxID=3118750 RepID=A0ABU7XDE3_9HYPH
MTSTAELWVAADKAILANDSKAANEIYDIISRREPSTPDDFLSVGLAAYRTGNVSRALEVLEAGHARYPGMPALAENFLRVGVEANQVDRLLKSLQPSAGKEACERLNALRTNWNTQVGLIHYAARAGFWQVANAGIEAMISACPDTIPLWRLSDILLTLGRKPDADRIYRSLAARPAENSELALYKALSLERLSNPEGAADRLEAELSKWPGAAYLREHLFRISLGMGQIERIVRLVDPGGEADPLAAEALFSQFSDNLHHLQLFDYFLAKGNLSLVMRRLDLGGSSPYGGSILWQLADKMDRYGFASESREIRQTLIDRPRLTALDAFFAAAAALRLSGVSVALEILEDAQRKFSPHVEVQRLYLQLCANQADYERYSRFTKSLGLEDDKTANSIADFYSVAARNKATGSFVLKYKVVQRMCAPREFEAVKAAFLDAVAEAETPSSQANALVFSSRYLDLDEPFSSQLWETLRGKAAEEGDTGGATLEQKQRALEMLFRLTPPIIQAGAKGSARQIDEFTEACRTLALRPIQMREPIQDMTRDWTPWQYIFCSGAIDRYNSAIAALENLAFKTWPRLNQTAAHVSAGLAGPGQGRRIRIGFITHDSMPMMSGLLNGFDPAVFETVYLRPGLRGQSRAAATWIERAERIVAFPDDDSYAAIDAIASEQLDIVISGPSMASMFFPMMARLAHLQMVLLEPNWTDGLTNADYYISWKPAEPNDPRAFYRTKAAFLDHPPYFIERPVVEPHISRQSRDEVRKRLLGVGASDRVYVCANTPPKIHPDMDAIFRRLLEADPDGVLVILRGDFPPSETLRTRLQQELGALSERVKFLPGLKQEEAHRLLLSVDCCLDSFPLCGMSSSFDATMLGVPLVTLPSSIPFGRWTAAIYDYIGVSGLTARDRDEYLEIALRLAKDSAWRSQLAEELREKAARFVESADSSTEFRWFIAQAWQRHLIGLPPADWINKEWRS